ncbi:hypothetical protein AOLI_G00297920 [Acnodon oligacanthus]
MCDALSPCFPVDVFLLQELKEADEDRSVLVGSCRYECAVHSLQEQRKINLPEPPACRLLGQIVLGSNRITLPQGRAAGRTDDVSDGGMRGKRVMRFSLSGCNAELQTASGSNISERTVH